MRDLDPVKAAILREALDQLAQRHPELRAEIDSAQALAASISQTAISSVLRARIGKMLETPAPRLYDESPVVSEQRLEEMAEKVFLFDQVGQVAALLGRVEGLVAASRIHYAGATQSGVHPFIEFSGLMNVYVELCRRAHAQGIRFEDASEHSGHALPMTPNDAAYLGEKLRCIFGPSLDASPKSAEALAKALFPKRST